MDLSPLEHVLAIATMLTGLLTGWSALEMARRFWHRPVTIRFDRGFGLRFNEAYKLYQGSFSHHEVDDKSTVKAWLRDYRKRRGRNDGSVVEYFMCSFRKGKARALFNGSFFPDAKTLFVCHFATRKLDVKKKTLTGIEINEIRDDLIKKVQSAIAKDGYKCDAIVAEVKDPEMALDEKEYKKRRARIRYLVNLARESNISLSVLTNVLYVVPQFEFAEPSELPVPNDDTHMLLMYGRLDAPLSDTMNPDEATRILRFVYETFYRDAYSYDDKDLERQSREELTKMCRNAIRKLPKTIRLQSRGF